MRLDRAYAKGAKAAKDRFKLGNLAAGAAAYNPSLNAGASGPMAMTTPKPVSPPAAPVATGAPKAGVLG